MLVGDDAALLAEAAAAARERLGCKVFAGRAEYLMAKHSQGAFDALPLPERCAATMHLLTDLELLAHTDYFVGAPAPYLAVRSVQDIAVLCMPEALLCDPDRKV